MGSTTLFLGCATGTISESAPLLIILLDPNFLLWSDGGSTFTWNALERQHLQQMTHKQQHFLRGDLETSVILMLAK